MEHALDTVTHSSSHSVTHSTSNHLSGEGHVTIQGHTGCVAGKVQYHGEHVDIGAGIQKCATYDHGSFNSYPTQGNVNLGLHF